MAIFEPWLKFNELLCKRTSRIEKDDYSCSHFKPSNSFHYDGCNCSDCARIAGKKTTTKLNGES